MLHVLDYHDQALTSTRIWICVSGLIIHFPWASEYSSALYSPKTQEHNNKWCRRFLICILRISYLERWYPLVAPQWSTFAHFLQDRNREHQMMKGTKHRSVPRLPLVRELPLTRVQAWFAGNWNVWKCKVRGAKTWFHWIGQAAFETSSKATSSHWSAMSSEQSKQSNELAVKKHIAYFLYHLRMLPEPYTETETNRSDTIHFLYARYPNRCWEFLYC